MPPHVKKQHFVPRFLLNHFANDDRLIWYFDKHLKRSELKGIGGVAFENHFYDKVAGASEGSFEKIYQRAESSAAPIIKQIIANKSLSELNQDDRITLAMFIVMQHNRTKSALQNTEQINATLWQGISDFARSAGAELEVEPNNSRDVWRSRLNDTPRFTEILLRKNWVLACSDNAFYTSDHPIVLTNHSQGDISMIRGTLGFDSLGIEIYFPLTPSLLLCLFCERTVPDTIDGIIACEASHVEYVNSLQVLQSHRFVFASTNDFTLAKDMLPK